MAKFLWKFWWHNTRAFSKYTSGNYRPIFSNPTYKVAYPIPLLAVLLPRQYPKTFKNTAYESQVKIMSTKKSTFIQQQSLNSDSAQVQILLAACHRFAMVSLTMVPAGNNVKRLSSANYTTKTIHHYHHHQKRQLHWTICIETEANTELSLLEKNMITEKGKQLTCFGIICYFIWKLIFTTYWKTH